MIPLVASLTGIASLVALPIWYEINHETPAWLLIIAVVSVLVTVYYQVTLK